MVKYILLALHIFLPLIFNAQPTVFEPKGIGGGGALFSPSINPADHNEYYVSCDMGELFHTTSFGAAYQQAHFSEMIAGHYSRVNFTNTTGLLYSIRYINEIPTPVKSIDNGMTWVTLAGNPDSEEDTYSIYTDFANPNRVMISYYGTIYFSTNGGQTFSSIHQAMDSDAGVVVGGVFYDGNDIYIGTNDGVLVSNNGGTSWQVANSSGLPANQRIWSFAAAKTGNITKFFCITADIDDIYVGVVGSDYWGFAKGVYAGNYTNGTVNWVSKSVGLNFNQDFPMFLAMAHHDTATVYLAGSNDQGIPDIIKSTNGGNSWSHVFSTTNNQNITTGWSGSGGDRNWGYGECPFGFDVADNDPNILIFSDFGFVHTSQNGGASWSQAYVSPMDQNAAGVNTPKRQYYASVGIENTTNWQIHWVDEDNMWACYSDIRGIRSEDKGAKWSFDYAGHTANTSYRIVQHPDGNLLMATSNIHDIYQSTHLQDSRLDQNDPNGKILYSTDNGLNWQNLHVFNHPVYWIDIDPNNANIAYASVIHYNGGNGQGGIYKTTNLSAWTGATWTLLDSPPRTQKHPACIVALNDGNMVCTYSGRRNSSGGFTASSGVFFYNSSLNTWSDVSSSDMHYWTKDIVVDPDDPGQNTWYVSVFSGWGGAPNGKGGLYKTTNRGQSWTKLTGSTLDRVHSCTFNPQDPNQIYVTTELQGLWKCDNINDNNPIFSRVDAYPFQQPVRVFFNPYDPSEMWVSSFGNGMRMGKIYPSDCHIVTNTNNDGPGSLRNAILCVKDGGTIFFDPGIVNDTIMLSGQALVLEKSVTLKNENSQKIAIRHQDQQLFNIHPNKNIWMENLHLQTTTSSAICIENSGNLTLKNIFTSSLDGMESKVINTNQGLINVIGSTQIK